MYAIIEKITPELTNLVYYSEKEWSIQKIRLDSLIKSGTLKLIHTYTFDEAKAYVYPRTPFNLYVSDNNPHDIIIKKKI